MFQTNVAMSYIITFMFCRGKRGEENPKKTQLKLCTKRWGKETTSLQAGDCSSSGNKAIPEID